MRSHQGIKTYTANGKTYTYYRPTSEEKLVGLKPFRILDGEDVERAVARRKQEILKALKSVQRSEPERRRLLAYIPDLFAMTRKRAVKKGLAFTISEADLVAALHEADFCCAVSGTPFKLAGRGKAYRSPWRPSIDRINPRQGYIPGNIRIVSVVVNTALGDWGDDVFWSMVESAMKHRVGLRQNPEFLNTSESQSGKLDSLRG